MVLVLIGSPKSRINRDPHQLHRAALFRRVGFKPNLCLAGTAHCQTKPDTRLRPVCAGRRHPAARPWGWAHNVSTSTHLGAGHGSSTYPTAGSCR